MGRSKLRAIANWPAVRQTFRCRLSPGFTATTPHNCATPDDIPISRGVRQSTFISREPSRTMRVPIPTQASRDDGVGAAARRASSPGNVLVWAHEKLRGMVDALEP